MANKVIIIKDNRKNRFSKPRRKFHWHNPNGRSKKFYFVGGRCPFCGRR